MELLGRGLIHVGIAPGTFLVGALALAISPWNRIAVPFAVAVVFPNFLFIIGSHVTGVNDLLADSGRPERLDSLPDRSLSSARSALGSALRKWIPYYAKEYVLFPALAGPFFWKVLAGNWLAETARNLYSAACIVCGHTGADVKSWPAGTRAHGRGEWYAMQVEAAQDFEVSLPLSILCGGLDRQIEHHLFPTLPPPRLRQIAPEVRAICERHGVSYKTGTWGKCARRSRTSLGCRAGTTRCTSWRGRWRERASGVPPRR